MDFDFNYEDSTIQASSGFKITKKNVPVDVRTVVDVYADIASIPNPYIGLTVTVKSDETNEGKMTDYKVISLKANGLGVPDSVVDEVKRMNEYIGSSNVDLSDYATIEYVKGELDDVDAVSLNGKKFSEPMSKAEFDALPSKDPNTIYIVNENQTITGVPDYSTEDKNKVLAINDDGTDLVWADPLSSATDLSGYYTKTEIDSKGYLTSIPSGYVTDFEMNEAIENAIINGGGSSGGSGGGNNTYEETYTTLTFPSGQNTITLDDTVVDCIANISFSLNASGDTPAFTNLFPYNPLSSAPNTSSGIQGYKGELEFIGDNVIKFTATDDGAIFMTLAMPETIIAGHKYLFRSFRSSDNITYSICSNMVGTANDEGKIPSGNYVFRINDVENGNSVYVKNPLILDLTDLYGEGNEPTADQMLINISEDVWYLGAPSPGTEAAGEPFTIVSLNNEGTTVDTFISTDADKTINLKAGGSIKGNGFLPSDLTISNVKNVVVVTNPDNPSSGGAVVTSKKEINLNNVDRLLFIGDSYTEGMYYQKGKAWVCQMSEQLDYTCESFGFGGNSCTDLSEKIKANATRFNIIGVKNLNSTRAMLMSFVNDMNKVSFDGTAYLNGLIGLIDTVRYMGANPIVCSEFTNQWNYGFGESVGSYCRNNNIDFWNIQPLTTFIGITRGEGGNEHMPYMSGSHPGQRTGGIIISNYLKFAKNLPRPLSAIKIYRLRNGINPSSLNDLLFNNRREKLLKFKEIMIAHSALSNEEDWDSLDALAGSIGNGVDSEYGKLMAGNNVNFGDYALVEVVLPSTRNHVKTAKLNISDSAVAIYVKTNEGFVATAEGVVTDLVNSLEYDKLTFLLHKTGGFNLNKVTLSWTGDECTKTPVPYNDPVLYCDVKEMLGFNTVEDTSKYTIIGTITPSDPTNYTKLPEGCTKLITVDDENYINVGVDLPTIPAATGKKVRFRVVARYNPSKGSSEINENSYDRKLLQIQPKGQQVSQTINRYTLTHEVDMSWTICEFDMDLSKKMDINIMSADSTPIEICYISMLEVK